MILRSVPPVVMLDTIGLAVLTPTGETQPDSLSRQREVKSKQKVCVLVAPGLYPLYPQSGQQDILDGHLAETESKKAREALLLPLEARGLELLLHDGGKVLRATLDYLHPHISH